MPRSTLAPEVAEREAKKAIEEIEEEIEREHPAKPKPAPHVQHGPQKSFVDKAWDSQYRAENRLKRIGHGRYGRVLKMARKPEPEEFQKASQITGLGILVLGLIGFLIFLLMTWVMGLLNVV
ncbi:MAG TPA: protein translocase SEC61 complex subunit gamma [Candidatus Thermoplasmatota archaeon]